MYRRGQECVNIEKLVHSVLVRTDVLRNRHNNSWKWKRKHSRSCLSLKCLGEHSPNLSLSTGQLVRHTYLQRKKTGHAPSTHSYTVEALSALLLSIFTYKEAISHIQSRNMAFFGTKRSVWTLKTDNTARFSARALSSLKADSTQMFSSNYERFCLLDRLHSRYFHNSDAAW